MAAEAAAGVEAELRASVQQQLQRHVGTALAAVCPAEVAVLCANMLQVPRERVQAATRTGGGDLVCHAPVAVYRRLRAEGNQREGNLGAAVHVSELAVDHVDGGDGQSEPAPVAKRRKVEHNMALRLAKTSEFGLIHERWYATETDFAEAIVQALPSEVYALAADVRVVDGGVICFTTRMHMEKQRAHDLLLCAQCGRFFAKGRGLRDHQQIKHRRDYEAASDAVSDCAKQLSVYRQWTPPALQSHWQSQAQHERTQRAALPPALEAARSGDIAELQRLVAEGHSMDVTDVHGSNALLWAAGSGHLDVCRLLVDQLRMNPHTWQQKDGRNALHWAARNGHLHVCRWLVDECGLNVDQPTADGTTAFHWAVWQGHMEVCRWLVEEARCDFRSLNRYGCNAGQWAAQRNDVAMCAWLRHVGLDLKLLNYNGHSCLHKAAVKGRRRVCEWLVAVGELRAEHMRPDQDGNTPAQMARLEGHTQLADWLELAAASSPSTGGLEDRGP